MKRRVCSALLVLLFLALATCKKEKKFVEPEYVFARWARAIEELNYRDYAACEAYPKSEGVFREIYRETYYADLMVTGVEKPDEKKVAVDRDGNSFIKRNVMFECNEIRRAGRRPIRVLRGDVDFIKFVSGEREKQGWMMWNRRIVRVER
ncbi:MAG TPA: hypothetical protein PKI31_18935 [Spirochaetota bacterium]|nr:hypothetical protein [Spirochaetota bacterium]